MQFAGGADSRFHVTWPGSPGRRGTTNIQPQRGRLSEEDVVVVKGVMTTTPARTAFDIARSTDWDHAVSVVDSALRLRLCTPADLVTVLARYARTPSASRVTRIFEFRRRTGRKRRRIHLPTSNRATGITRARVADRPEAGAGQPRGKGRFRLPGLSNRRRIRREGEVRASAEGRAGRRRCRLRGESSRGPDQGYRSRRWCG